VLITDKYPTKYEVNELYEVSTPALLRIRKVSGTYFVTSFTSLILMRTSVLWGGPWLLAQLPPELVRPVEAGS